MVKSKAIEIIKDIHSEDIDPEDKLRWMVEDYV